MGSKKPKSKSEEREIEDFDAPADFHAGAPERSVKGAKGSKSRSLHALRKRDDRTDRPDVGSAEVECSLPDLNMSSTAIKQPRMRRFSQLLPTLLSGNSFLKELVAQAVRRGNDTLLIRIVDASKYSHAVVDQLIAVLLGEALQLLATSPAVERVVGMARVLNEEVPAEGLSYRQPIKVTVSLFKHVGPMPEPASSGRANNVTSSGSLATIAVEGAVNPDLPTQLLKISAKVVHDGQAVRFGGLGKQLNFSEQFKKAQLAEKIGLLEGESPQTLNAVAIKAISDLRSLDKVAEAFCTELAKRGQSLTHAQFAALLENATPRLQQAVRAQLSSTEQAPDVPVKQVRSLKDLESLRHKFFQAVVFGDAEPSLKRFKAWLKKMAAERFPDFESKQTAAQAAVYWQSVLADGLLRLDGKECLFTATKGERGSGVFRARFRKSGESTTGTGKAQDKQEYSGVSFPSLTTS